MNYRQAKKIDKRINRVAIFSFELADKIQAATGFSDAKFNKAPRKRTHAPYINVIVVKMIKEVKRVWQEERKD